MDALYQYEARHFSSSNAKLRRFHRLVTAIAIVVTLILMGVIYIDPSGSLAGHYYPVGIVNIYVTSAVVVFGLFTDFYYATLPIGKIQREIATGHWDLVRLTAIDEHALITTNYALTQRRAQRMVFLEQTLRYACVWLILWNILCHGYIDGTILVAIVMIAVPFILDPPWRMQMLSALGVACGVNVADYNMGILATIPVIVVTRMAALIVIYYASALIAGSANLDSLTMLVIIPLAGLIEFQLCQRIRVFVLSRALHLAEGQIADILADTPDHTRHLRYMWEPGEEYVE